MDKTRLSPAVGGSRRPSSTLPGSAVERPLLPGSAARTWKLGCGRPRSGPAEHGSGIRAKERDLCIQKCNLCSSLRMSLMVRLFFVSSFYRLSEARP